jgi:hypothetical protein
MSDRAILPCTAWSIRFRCCLGFNLSGAEPSCWQHAIYDKCHRFQLNAHLGRCHTRPQRTHLFHESRIDFSRGYAYSARALAPYAPSRAKAVVRA